MKKFGKVVAVAASATMVAGLMTACGGATNNGGNASAAPKEYTYEAKTSNDGKVLNVYAWNDEYITRFNDYYPGYVPNNEKDVTAGGKIGDVEVKFSIVASKDNAYQDNLDSHLLKQDSADAADKIDIFLVEADYALKYVDTNYTLDMKDLGLDTAIFGDQYQYTKDVVTDGKGRLKGSSWQGCPGALIYRAEIAEKVFGTAEPDKVQEYVKDWDTFKTTAATLKDAGYMITATVNDTYRVFSNNVSTKWVDANNNIQIDANIKAWAEMSKAMVDAGQTKSAPLWEDEWSKGFYTTGNVFCYFGPAWLIDFSMHGDEEGSVGIEGGWRVCKGPQGFFWGGTWVCAANGTDNADLVADIIKVTTTDDATLSKIIEEKADFVNDSKLIEKYASDANFGDAILGGQNPLSTFSAGVSTVDLSKLTAYDQGCNEEFQNAMKGYFDGNYATYDDAVKAFYTAVTTKYPALNAPK